MCIEELIHEIEAIGYEVQLDIYNDSDEFIRYIISRGSKDPFRFGLLKHKGDGCLISFYGHVNSGSWNFDGVRADMNYFLAMVYTLFLRCAGIRPTLTPYTFDFLHNEIKFIEIGFDDDRYEYIELNNDVKELVIAVLAINHATAHMLNWGFEIAKRYEYNPEDNYCEDFDHRVSKAIPFYDECALYKRINPDFKWAYSQDFGFSLFEVEDEGFEHLLMPLMEKRESTKTENFVIFKMSDAYNAFPKNTLDFLNGSIDGIQNDAHKAKETFRLFYAIDNVVFVMTNNHIASIAEVCDSRIVNYSREELKNKISKQIDTFLPHESFNWKFPVSPDRFERLIFELLRIESTFFDVKRVGHVNEPDGGRDIIVMKRTASIYNEGKVVEYIDKKIIVQCKAYKSGVGKRDVQDLRDLLDYYDADGYLLVVSSHVKRGLFDYLSHLREKRNFDIDWWTKDDLDSKINSHPALLKEFRDIISIIE